MASIYEKFGNKVKQLRRKTGMSQEELAAKAKLDLTSINEIENGTRNPSLKTINKLSSGLKTPIKELFD